MFNALAPVLILLVPLWYLGVFILLFKIWQELRAIRTSRGL